METSPENSSSTTPERILQAASRLFARRGYHGTSTRDIAKEVGIRQPSLFHHFASKDQIMSTLQRLEFMPTVRLLEAASTGEDRPAARLFGYLFLDVQRMLSSPYDFSGTTVAAVLNDPTLAQTRALYDRIQDLQTALIAKGIASGELADLQAQFANSAVEWLIEGILVDAARQPDLDPERFADYLASFVVRALLADLGDLDEIRAAGRELTRGELGEALAEPNGPQSKPPTPNGPQSKPWPSPTAPSRNAQPPTAPSRNAQPPTAPSRSSDPEGRSDSRRAIDWPSSVSSGQPPRAGPGPW